MASLAAIKPTPHTRIDNAVIDDYLPLIGAIGFAVYVVIKRHHNARSGQCNPSYATIARKIGIDRGTVIRYVKKLVALELISPIMRFTEEGHPTSNQYNFPNRQETDIPSDQAVKGGCTQPLPPVAENNRGSCQEKPEQVSLNNLERENNKEVFAIENHEASNGETTHTLPHRQQTCTHPQEEIKIFNDGVTICRHCFGLIDEGQPIERVA